MGMFDTVVFTCPRCDAQLEAQSKAGKCSLRTINSYEVPIAIAGDLKGESVWCEECQRSWTIVALTLPQVTPMGLV